MTDCVPLLHVPALVPDQHHDEDMISTCFSSDSDDDSFCSMDASDDEEDDTLCFDTEDEGEDNDDNESIMSLVDIPDDSTSTGTVVVDVDTQTESEDDDNDIDQVEFPLPQLIEALFSNRSDFVAMDLCFPIANQADFYHVVRGIRSNKTVTECSVSATCFQSLTMPQRRELADAISNMASLKCLVMDTVFPEFLYALNGCRCWKRDHYYRQYRRYWEFRNNSIEEIRITQIPANVEELLLGRLVMMTLANFAGLQRLDITFAAEFASAQAALMRVALTGLSNSRSLANVKFGYNDEDGDYCFIKELDATRKDCILRVLKLRCAGEQLSERSYRELAEMLQVHSQSLKGLVLDTAVDNNGALTIANTLGRNNNLKALCLGTFDCQDENRIDGLLSLISQVLCPQNQMMEGGHPNDNGVTNGSTLEYLSLVCQELDDHGVHQISKVLSQSSLRELMLFLDNTKDDSSVTSNQGVSAFAELLETSDTIEELSLICNALDDEGVLAIMSVLERSNRTLRTLRLQCTKDLSVTSKGYQAVVQMLKANTVVETLELSRCQPDEENTEDDEGLMVTTQEPVDNHIAAYQLEMEYYLRLNRAGVRNLQLNTGVTPSQFLGKVVSQRNELDSLFYMLSTNPAFVSFGV